MDRGECDIAGLSHHHPSHHLISHLVASTSPRPHHQYWRRSVATNAAIADWYVFMAPGADATTSKSGAGSASNIFTSMASSTPNLFVVKTDLAERYRSALGFPVPMTSQNSKGLKATLGAVWSDHITNYSHYAWSDVDVVYGDLETILSPRMRRADVEVITLIPPHAMWCQHKAIFGKHAFVAAPSRLYRLHSAPQSDSSPHRPYKLLLPPSPSMIFHSRTAHSISQRTEKHHGEHVQEGRGVQGRLHEPKVLQDGRVWGRSRSLVSALPALPALVLTLTIQYVDSRLYYVRVCYG